MNSKLLWCLNVVAIVISCFCFLYFSSHPEFFFFVALPAMLLAHQSTSRVYLIPAILGYGLMLIIGYFSGDGIITQISLLTLYLIYMCVGCEWIYRSSLKSQAALHSLQKDHQELIEYAVEGTRDVTKLNDHLRKEIAGRKIIEQQLEENEKLFETIIELVPYPIFAKDAHGTFLFANQALADSIGLQLNEIIGKQVFDVIADREEAKQLLADDLEVLHKGKHIIVPERTITSKTGHTKVFLLNKIPFQMPNTKETAVLGVGIDITDFKNAERSLQKSESKYRELVQNANSIILRMDRNARVTFFNEFAQEFFGYTEDEILGKSVFGTIVPEVDSKGVELEPIMKHLCLHPEKYSRNENENICKDGKRVQIEWVNRGIYTQDGESVGVLSIGNDVTQLRELQQQLIQSQKMESIGRLAGGVAHDFNNLLTVIIGYSESLLLQDDLDELSQSELQEIKTAGERAGTLTKQLLAFSRKQVMKPEVLDACCVIQQMEKMLCRLIGEDIELSTEFSDDILYIKADQSQLEQVIMNLVVNARDAMPNGGKISVTVKTVRIEEKYSDFPKEMKAGDYVKISVTDTGVGIEKEKLDLIFEPFYTTKEEGKGTGLGLSTVYGIIKQSGGYIYAFSEVGKGTTISIYLRLCTLDDVVSTEPEACLIDVQGQETILLAEDDSSVRFFITRILEGSGYKVLAVESGIKALETASTYQAEIDLLITDMIMPNMTGKELAVQLLQTRSDVKVLITSGYTSEKVVYEDLYEKGFHFMQKPITKDVLLHTIRNILKG